MCGVMKERYKEGLINWYGRVRKKGGSNRKCQQLQF